MYPNELLAWEVDTTHPNVRRYLFQTLSVTEFHAVQDTYRRLLYQSYFDETTAADDFDCIPTGDRARLAFQRSFEFWNKYQGQASAVRQLKALMFLLAITFYKIVYYDEQAFKVAERESGNMWRSRVVRAILGAEPLLGSERRQKRQREREERRRHQSRGSVSSTVSASDPPPAQRTKYSTASSTDTQAPTLRLRSVVAKVCGPSTTTTIYGQAGGLVVTVPNTVSAGATANVPAPPAQMGANSPPKQQKSPSPAPSTDDSTDSLVDIDVIYSDSGSEREDGRSFATAASFLTAADQLAGEEFQEDWDEDAQELLKPADDADNTDDKDNAGSKA